MQKTEQVNLTAAFDQWQNRPADERFGTLDELYQHTTNVRAGASEGYCSLNKLKVEYDNEAKEMQVSGPNGNAAYLNNWSFGQLASRVKAPAAYLRTLPHELVEENLNHGIANAAPELDSNILIHSNGRANALAITSGRYARIWNMDIVERLLRLKDMGWVVPPARPAFADQPGTREATEEDCLRNRSMGLSIHPGDLIAPSGLYASDRDMFVFMVNEHDPIDDGSEGGLSRGFFVKNSEVGAAAFTIEMFFLRVVCGNHIVWDASGMTKLSIRHVGSANEKAFSNIQRRLERYLVESKSETEGKIVTAKKYTIGAEKDDVIDAVFGFGSIKNLISKKDLMLAYDKTEEFEYLDGEPNTAWGLAQGVTRISQDKLYMEERNKLDRAAGKILQMAF